VERKRAESAPVARRIPSAEPIARPPAPRSAQSNLTGIKVNADEGLPSVKVGKRH
jgi:hypothetical protein